MELPSALPGVAAVLLPSVRVSRGLDSGSSHGGLRGAAGARLSATVARGVVDTGRGDRSGNAFPDAGDTARIRAGADVARRARHHTPEPSGLLSSTGRGSAPI